MNAHELPPPLAGLEATLPSSWYRSESVFAVEKERIFCREWVCVGREEELIGPGAFRLLDVLGESIILVRNGQSQLRAFYNVCRHRGTRLCREPAAAGPGAAQLPPHGAVGAPRAVFAPPRRQRPRGFRE